jgi:putative membrane protein
MKGLFIRWLVLTVAIMAAAYVLDGIEIEGGFFSAFFAAAILGILNALFRPILLLITLPLNILTLGLFTFVINALMLMMASGVIAGFHVQGFWWAVVGSLIISAVSWLLTSLINDQGRMEVISLRRRHGRWE